MKEIEIVAKTKGQPDLKGKCKQYDSLVEAEKELGKEIALERLNTQIKTDAMNRLRKPATGAVALGKLIAAAKTSGRLTPDLKARLEETFKKAGVTVPEGIL